MGRLNHIAQIFGASVGIGVRRRFVARHAIPTGAFVIALTVPQLVGFGTNVEEPNKPESSVRQDSRSADQRTRQELSRRLDKLRMEYQEVDKECLHSIEVRDEVLKRLQTSKGVVKEDLRVEAERLTAEAARYASIWERKRDALLSMDRRVRNLKGLWDLRDLCAELDSKKKGKISELQEAEARWGATHAKLLDAECFSRFSNRQLERIKEPRQPISAVQLDLLRFRPKELEERPARGDALRSAEDRAARWRKSVDLLRKEERALWDQRKRLSDVILDIDISLNLARIDLEYLEASRAEWDRSNEEDGMGARSGNGA